jgi:hypothetical protein
MVKIFSLDNKAFDYTKTDTCDSLVIRNHSNLSETYA